MEQILYCNLTSPYARRVRVLLRVLGLEQAIQEEIVDPFTSPRNLIDRNPLSKIPVLVDGGLTLPDSSLIMAHLLDQAGEEAQRWPARRGDWAAAAELTLAEGIIDAAVAIVMENRRPESIRFPEQIDRQTATIRRVLPRFENRIGAQGGTASMAADITLSVALAYLDFRVPWLAWREDHACLDTWLGERVTQAAMQATKPPDGPH
ncbi:glutathione S-transferase N-terminal domain-containing protein [Algiphilus sp. NNCM1]|uniref:glutathione S-transferase family protein n=1 Tax=Algiphilus sp. TaxID=1872431 RepID=UPI001CA659AB|nr:glutathione S-transferase N-terminal domain-containing protein [Algiphilus sp.]MBY8966509.1 glutathione S-transferase N-terminal domain-containing protein [Algiphilus acroporae]MCI5061454.1 glutathione S-transferase N-terminal domain-containing protein [Algiphilus sp.]MCI5104488.1 glutathione S-transferase N-terminal domain-containing protein [Algiphilus sp.]